MSTHEEIRKFTHDYYIDIVVGIARACAEKDDARSIRCAIVAYAHVDVLIVDKGLGMPIGCVLEAACLRFIKESIGDRKLERMRVPPEEIQSRTVQVASLRIELARDLRMFDKFPFAHVPEERTYNADEAVAMLRDRLQTMHAMGFSHNAVLQSAVVSRQFFFDRYMTKGEPYPSIKKHGDDILRVLPCELAVATVWYGTREDTIGVMRLLEIHTPNAVGGLREWKKAMSDVADESLEWNETFIRAVAQCIAQALAYSIDEREYEKRLPPPKEKDQFWLSLDDLDDLRGIGNYPPRADADFRRHALGKAEDFARTCRDAPDTGRDTDTLAKSVNYALNAMIVMRTRSVAWEAINDAIVALLHLMWQYIHMSKYYSAHADMSTADEYLRALVRFAGEVSRRIDIGNVKVEYDGRVIGTIHDHTDRLEQYSKHYSAVCVRGGAPAKTYKKYSRAVTSCAYLVLHAYTTMRGENMAGCTLDEVSAGLQRRTNEIASMSAPHDTRILPPWHWIYIRARNDRGSTSGPVPYKRDIGTLHCSTAASRRFLYLFRRFHITNT